MNLLLTLLASPWHAGFINSCPISGQAEHKGTALVSNCRLAGPLLWAPQTAKRTRRKAPSWLPERVAGPEGGSPGPVVAPSRVWPQQLPGEAGWVCGSSAPRQCRAAPRAPHALPGMAFGLSDPREQQTKTSKKF